MDIQSYIAYDKELLLTLNGSHSYFLDGVFWTATSMWTWMPLAAMLLYILIKNNGLWKGLLTVVVFALVVTVADQMASEVCKPFFQRYRPSNDSEIMYLVDIVNGHRGGRYGFMSSHAANTFAIMLFMSLEVRSTLFTLIHVFFAFVNIFSRVYLGLHYPGDILCGALLGLAVGGGGYALLRVLKRRFFNSPLYISSQYTSGGYDVEDVNRFATVFLLTNFYIVIMGLLAPYLKAF